MALQIGDRAPDFEARLSDGTTFSLKSRRGRRNVVLYFYPKDFTSGCTAEACTFRDRSREFDDLDTDIIGVSRDTTESHERFIDTHGLNFPLISDADGKISGLYGVQRLGGRLGVHRTTFVINKEGMIVKIIHKEIKPAEHIPLALQAIWEIEKGRATAGRS